MSDCYVKTERCSETTWRSMRSLYTQPWCQRICEKLRGQVVSSLVRNFLEGDILQIWKWTPIWAISAFVIHLRMTNMQKQVIQKVPEWSDGPHNVLMEIVE